MPVRIYQAVISGDYGTASALGTTLLGMTAVAVYAAFRLSGRRDTSFL
jgi:ABC-type Fe3+ transport system permease subunit